MKQVPMSSARAQLAEIVNQVQYGKDTVALLRNNKVVALIVPPGYVQKAPPATAAPVDLFDAEESGR